MTRTDSEDSHFEPVHRKWYFLGRFFEICCIGIALGITAYVSTSQNATGWPPDSGAHGALGFLAAATGLGFISALSSLFVLCFKYNARDVLSKNRHGYKGFNMAFVYLGVVSGTLSIGAGVYTAINMGHPGLHCRGDSMNSYQFCIMVKAIVALTLIGAVVTLVSAVAEWWRIQQWKQMLEQLQVTYR